MIKLQTNLKFRYCTLNIFFPNIIQILINHTLKYGNLLEFRICDHYLEGNFGRYRCAVEIAKTPQCIYIAIK